MGLLDRFKPQPRWKHADPQVRAAGVQELSDEEQDLLASIARTDPDARVRRAAVSKLGSVAVLSDVVRHDQDPDVRDEASGVLLDIALGAYEADEAASLAAVDGLRALPPADAQKQLVLVAKTARREAVSRRALDGLAGDARALGTTARRADAAAIRLDALARLADPQELAAVSLKADYKDVALAALERVSDAAALRAIAARAKNAAAQRRARAMVRAIEDAEAAAEAARLAALERQRRAQQDAVRDLEALAGEETGVGFRLEAIEARWQDVSDGADPDLVRRHAEARAAADAACAREAERAAARAAAERAHVAAIEARQAICARVESLSGTSIASALEDARADWAAAPPLSGGDAAAVTRRFDAACRAAEARVREAAMHEQTLQHLDALCVDLEKLAADESFPASADARTRWVRLRDEWRESLAALEPDERSGEATERWARIDQQLVDRDAARREREAASERDVQAQAERAAAALERLATIPEATLKALDRALREARASVAALDAAPSSAARDAVRARLVDAQPPIVQRAQELREADDWQRWANASVQEQLIGRMEALAGVEDLAEVAREMRHLQAEWQKVAAGPREQGQALWRRFKTALDAARARTEPFFEDQARHRADHLRQKLSLCERAEALADSTDWIATADAIKALQAEWKTVGPGPRKEEQAAWERFRAACDRFFTRRHEDLAQRKHSWAENLAKKEALCARAEELAASTEWDAASAELRRLQAEWKTIGPVKKNRSDAIWFRFRTACDTFFDRYKGRHSIDIANRVASRESIVSDLEALARTLGAPIAAEPGAAAAPAGAAADEAAGEEASAHEAPAHEPSEDVAEAAAAAAPVAAAPAEPMSREALLARVRELRAGWQHAPAVPREAGAALARRFDAALAAIVSARQDATSGTELDIAANVRRLQDLVSRAERLAGQAPAPRAAVSPAALLATRLREALAANTIGGRVDDEARWRSAEQELRQIQSEWTRVGFVPDPDLRPLTSRFQRASQRLYDQREQRRRSFAGKVG